MTRPHAALPCHHTTPTSTHIAAALAPFSSLCACGRELVPPQRRCELHEQTRADLTHVHRRGGRGGEIWQLPACAQGGIIHRGWTFELCIIRIIYLLLYNTQRIIAAKRMQGGSVGGVLEEIMGMGLGWGPSRVRR